MSLESQIADLVSATNDLIATFSGKKASIDSAVQAALQAIPSNQRAYYVSSLTGDDANAGSTSAPLKTLKKAIDLVPVGGQGVIYLAAGEEHLIAAQIGVVNKVLSIARWGDGARPILRSVPYVSAGSNLCYGIAPSGGTSIVFNGVSIKTADLADVAATNGAYGFISRGDCTSAVIFLFSAEIEINRQGFMAGAGGGSVLNLSLYNTTITRPNGAGSLLSINSNAARLTTSGVTLPAGTTLNDLVLGVVRDANSVPRNLLCNSVI